MEWLDRLIRAHASISEEGKEITEAELALLLQKLRTEKSEQIGYVRAMMLSLDNEDSQQFFITNHYTYAHNLLDLALNRPNSNSLNNGSDQLASQITTLLTDLITAIYRQYSLVINLNSRAPEVYLKRVQRNWKSQIPFFTHELNTADPGIAYVILTPVRRWLGTGSTESKTIRHMLYFSRLRTDLNFLIPITTSESYFSNLEKHLIRINFNSHDCFDHLTIRIAQVINKMPTYFEKLDKLLLISKELKQQIIIPDVGLHPMADSLVNSLEKWISQEIIYLERKTRDYLIPTSHNADPLELRSSIKKEPHSKVLCMLTVDQMAILLRAADESKLLNAKSISAVYKQITPYLSSPFKEEISPDSMRSKSYAAEDRDKAIVIDALHRMVKKIEQF